MLYLLIIPLRSLYGQNSETSSSYGDSGIQSSSSRPSAKQHHQQQVQQRQEPAEPHLPQQASKKGLSEFFSKGITANWKLLSKSSQQVYRKLCLNTVHRKLSINSVPTVCYRYRYLLYLLPVSAILVNQFYTCLVEKISCKLFCFLPCY